MIQYTSCPDPTESAARRERMRQAEEQGDFEETAARMVRASLDNQILVPQSPNNPQISTHERISALQRLGTSRLLISIWGNLVGFYVINFLFSAIPSSGMYTIMFRLCSQPSYWITMFVSIRRAISRHLSVTNID